MGGARWVEDAVTQLMRKTVDYLEESRAERLLKAPTQ